MSRRRGSRLFAYTLVELIVTMSAGSALMVLATGVVHQAMQLSSSARNHADHQRSLQRLSRQFRHDVHLCNEWEFGADTATLQMPGDQRVTYTVSADSVRRIQAADGDRVRHENFELLEKTVVTFEQRENPPRAVLSVRVNAHHAGLSTNGGHQRLDRRVEAVIGRRLKLPEPANATEGEAP